MFYALDALLMTKMSYLFEQRQNTVALITKIRPGHKATLA
jgi:hypothetical protein